jgi:predicted ATP-grasp superfamily ATP-dependent carboligase
MNDPVAAARTAAIGLHSTSDQPFTLFAPAKHAETAPKCATALILASEWRLAYKAMRCAAHCFERVYVLGTSGARPLARSLFCRSFYHLPFEEGFGPSAVAYINDLCDRLLVDVVMPSHTATTRFLSEHGAELLHKCYPLPDKATFDLLNDKRTFVALCRSLGVPTPRTQVLSDSQQLIDRIRGGELELPLVVKPTDMDGSRGVVIVRSVNALDPKQLRYSPLLVQDYIDGRDLCAFYLCRDGSVEYEVVYRHGGHFLEFIEHQGIGRHCRKIIEAMHYSGVIGFDIRQRRDGDFYFLECNPRFWYNMELVMLAGCNFVEHGVKGARMHVSLDRGLVGTVMVRLAGLLRTSRGRRGGLASRLAVLGHLSKDLPMLAPIGLNKIWRMVFKEPPDAL